MMNRPEFPLVFPSVPDCFEKCNTLNIFTQCIKQLPSEIQTFLKQKLQSPFFVRRRMNSGKTKDLKVTPQISELFSCVELCDPDLHPNLIAAIAIISSLPIDFILEQLEMNFEMKQIILMKALVESTSKPYPVPFYLDDADRTSTIDGREYVPSTYNWTISGNPFNEVPEESREFIKNCFGKTLPDDFDLNYRFTPDLSNGFNRSHGIVDCPCINEDDHLWPRKMKWIANLEFPVIVSPHCVGCSCHKHDCLHCHTYEDKSGKSSMHYNEDGTVNIEELNTHKPLIIECNDSCSCDPHTCKNRVIDHRAKIHLLVCRAISKNGWGVKTLEFIPRGTFVCEYLGDIITDPDHAEEIGNKYDQTGESYLFDLDGYGIDDKDMLTLDPHTNGNVSMFINHNCEPNIITISIGTCESHQFHRIGFFAMRDIYPNEDLGFHYGYKFETKIESRMIPCNCGSLICRGRLR